MAKLDPDDTLLTEIRKNFKDSKEHSSEWRVETIESFDFVANRQWSQEDQSLLEEQGRPIITFNRMGPYFDAISGYEVNNRQEIKFKPRTHDDSKQIEILNAATQWILDETNAQDEESSAFTDCLIGGMGWISTHMDYEIDLDGKVVMERIDPLEMYWDPYSRKKNLSDARYIQRIQWKTEKEIKDQWPDAELNASANVWEDDMKSEPHNASLAFLYKTNSTGYDEKSGRHRVIQHQHYELKEIYRVVDPASGKQVELEAKKFKAIKKLYDQQGIELTFAKQKKRLYKQCFIVGDEIVEKSDLPCGFTFKPITGKLDRNKNLFYGLARVMKDPQRWANKFFSQILHIINSNAKGGLMAEEGAFVDPKKAEETWADPSAVVLMKNGAISGGKVKERTASNYPQGLDKMLQFAVTSIPDVTGVNPEFMGAVDRQQAGVLEQERKKSAFVILAGFFDAMRLYRKEQGRLLMHFIKEYLNDGRIIRITTPQGEQPVQLILTDDTMVYDVVVDQAPDSPNLKEEVWSTLGSLIPQFLKAGIPLPPDILKFSPLPADMAMQFAQGMSGKLPQKAQEAMNGMQQEIQKLTQENQKLQLMAREKMSAIQVKHELGKEQNAILAQQIGTQDQQHGQNLEQKERESVRDMMIEMKKMGMEQQQALMTARKEMQIDMDNRMKDMQIAQLNAEVKSSADRNKQSIEREKLQKEPPVVVNNVSETLGKAITDLASRLDSQNPDAIKESIGKLAKSMDERPIVVNMPEKPRKIRAKITRDSKGVMTGAELEA